MLKATRLAGLVTALLVTGMAQASLIDRGGGLIYDTELGVTWLKDANYAKTSDYDSDGLMTWSEASAWAAGLTYGGYTDWRLPTTLQPDPSCSGQFNIGPPYGTVSAGFGCTGSEMGHLFYQDLGGNPGSSVLSSGDPDLSLFQNIQDAYWSGTAFAPVTDHFWSFFFNNGYQVGNDERNQFYAWAVRDGDVATVPEPATIALLMAGLGLMGVIARRRGAPDRLRFQMHSWPPFLDKTLHQRGRRSLPAKWILHRLEISRLTQITSRSLSRSVSSAFTVSFLLLGCASISISEEAERLEQDGKYGEAGDIWLKDANAKLEKRDFLCF